eukprot:Blabericola_migrator_1__4168@NODE_2275_length_3018_cov_68_038292_g678_i1_p1_GENE_NODE_2275_length_3018_cov_68_038292_g678_i1NODE_2275_length_3018_cov_68_038292_g678_i1_p1_ORF_typecomplete_len390_score95_99Helicase_C/PF00271_31/7_4e16HDA23/PF11496_8/1_1e02HDA23/PF11496_8/3_7e12ERCC3_RAD25_C/PF16203_5/1_7e10_NODE_2275_length_3018_cov_68_038292_g678_i11621331
MIDSICTNKKGLVLTIIQALMKVCTHPLLVPLSNAAKALKEAWDAAVLTVENDKTRQLLMNPRLANLRQQAGGMMSRNRASNADVEPPSPDDVIAMSGKFVFVFTLLKTLRSTTTDRVVIISNFTQTLDLIESLCQNQRFPVIRLDGSTGISKRHAQVQAFNTKPDSFVFLLSSKAGGAGINLIGANRLIMVDPDWNPANDAQALARIWRDGQKKTCFIYRLFSAGSVEEKILQRQMAKESISSIVVKENHNDAFVNDVIPDEILENLFEFDPNNIPISGTHDILECQCMKTKQPLLSEQVETDLSTWNHSATFASNCLLEHDKDVVTAVNLSMATYRPWQSPHPPVCFTMACLVKSSRETAPIKENLDPDGSDYEPSLAASLDASDSE